MRRLLFLVGLLLATPAFAGMQGMGPVASNPGGSITSIAVTSPTVQSGLNCELVAAITTPQAITVSLAGWTSQQVCTAGVRETSFLTKAASGTEGGSYTFSLSASTGVEDGRIFAFCGVNTSNPIDQKSCNNSSLVSPSLTPTVKNEDMLIMWHPGNGAPPTGWPAGVPQNGIDPVNGGEANYAALITNASAQSYTMTASTASPYSGAMIFNMNGGTNNRVWGIRSFQAQTRQASGTSYAMTAPINIVGSEDRIDMIFILENTATPSISGGSSSWSCTNLASPSGEKIWHCVGTGLSSSDTTYTATWTGSAGATGYLVDTIWATGTDAHTGQSNASSATCSTSTLTTASANEPVLSWCGLESGGVMGGYDAATSPIFSPGTKTSNTTPWQVGNATAFEMKATAGVTTSRTWSCSNNCGTTIGGGIQVAQAVATPVPAATGKALFMSPY